MRRSGYFCNPLENFGKLQPRLGSVKLQALAHSKQRGNYFIVGIVRLFSMEVVAKKAIRRSTRIRVEIPISVISLDKRRPFAEKCVAVIVSAQGCGFRSSKPLQAETPILLSDLPSGGTTSGRVANCLPLGNDGKYFLIGVSLYNHGNFWGIADPPADWGVSSQAASAAAGSASVQPASSKQSWPYNLFPSGSEAHPGRK